MAGNLLIWDPRRDDYLTNGFFGRANGRYVSGGLQAPAFHLISKKAH
jgi:hypothetical protein